MRFSKKECFRNTKLEIFVKYGTKITSKMFCKNSQQVLSRTKLEVREEETMQREEPVTNCGIKEQFTKEKMRLEPYTKYRHYTIITEDINTILQKKNMIIHQSLYSGEGNHR